MKKILTLTALILLATACGASTSTSSSTSTDDTTTLAPVQISEWGVEFTPVKSISDVRYAIDSNHNDTADFSSASLMSLDQQFSGSQCATGDAPLGTISRVANFGAFTSSGHTVPTNVQIGTYYYYYSPPQGTCSVNQAVQNLQSLQAADLSAAMNSLKATSAK